MSGTVPVQLAEGCREGGARSSRDAAGGSFCSGVVAGTILDTSRLKRRHKRRRRRGRGVEGEVGVARGTRRCTGKRVERRNNEIAATCGGKRKKEGEAGARDREFSAGSALFPA